MDKEKEISLETLIKYIFLFSKYDSWKDLIEKAKISPSTAMRFIKYAKKIGLLQERKEIIGNRARTKFVIMTGKYKINIGELNATIDISLKGGRIYVTLSVEDLYS